MNDFSVWLRTGSNPTDINRFRCVIVEKENLNFANFGDHQNWYWARILRKVNNPKHFIQFYCFSYFTKSAAALQIVCVRTSVNKLFYSNLESLFLYIISREGGDQSFMITFSYCWLTNFGDFHWILIGWSKLAVSKLFNQ